MIASIGLLVQELVTGQGIWEQLSSGNGERPRNSKKKGLVVLYNRTIPFFLTTTHYYIPHIIFSVGDRRRQGPPLSYYGTGAAFVESEGYEARLP